MPYPSEGTLTTESREVAVSETWDTWANAQSMSNVVVENGVLMLEDIDIPPSGISRWGFEDDSDTSIAVDSWGDNDGAISGATYTSDSQVGDLALDFDGTDDAVDVTGLPGLSSFSIAWYMLPRDTSENNVVINFEENNGLQFRIESDGGMYFYFYDGGYQSAGSASLTTGSWDFWALTYDGSTAIVYKNDANQQFSASSVSHQTVGNNEDWIGVQRGSSDYADAIIDDPRLYDKALTSTEVSDLYNTGSIL